MMKLPANAMKPTACSHPSVPVPAIAALRAQGVRVRLEAAIFTLRAAAEATGCGPAHFPLNPAAPLQP